MAKGRGAAGRVDRLERLFEAGDHGAARRAAEALRADAQASTAEVEAAAALLARIAPDRAVQGAAATAIATSLVVAGWLLTR